MVLNIIEPSMRGGSPNCNKDLPINLPARQTLLKQTDFAQRVSLVDTNVVFHVPRVAVLFHSRSRNETFEFNEAAFFYNAILGFSFVLSCARAGRNIAWVSATNRCFLIALTGTRNPESGDAEATLAFGKNFCFYTCLFTPRVFAHGEKKDPQKMAAFSFESLTRQVSGISGKL